MQIGEFAKICKTKISVLRHYDKEGLLTPDYTDTFTGYRYYSKDQIQTFFEISALKEAGFSLGEIKEITSGAKGSEDKQLLFSKKQEKLKNTLQKLAAAKNLILGDDNSVEFIKTDNGNLAHYAGDIPCDKSQACSAMESAFIKKGYQRTSPFRTVKAKDGTYSLECDAVKLRDTLERVHEDIALSFEDDSRVVGKWQVEGEFSVVEDFFFQSKDTLKSTYLPRDTIYFLPNGEDYWCYSWTRGKLILTTGNGCRCINDYELFSLKEKTYMHIKLKSYYYRRGGKPTSLILSKLDDLSYKKEDLARKDNIDMPFVNDERVLGEWRCAGFVHHKEDFDPTVPFLLEVAYQKVEFFEGGRVKSTFTNGGYVDSPEMQEWTRGFVLRKWTQSACAYEIRKIGGKEYMFLEWKSGNYIYGALDTDYYVFERWEG